MHDEKAFDAGESYLCEADRKPSGKWRPVSLVTAILRLIKQGPSAQPTAAKTRYDTIRAAAAQLTARGLDATALIRYGMSEEAIAPITSALMLTLLFGMDSSIPGVDVTAWCTALSIDPPPPFTGEPGVGEMLDRFRAVISPAISLLMQWIGNASLEEIVSLAAPPSGEFTAITGLAADERDLHEQYRWVVDHFSQTFYRDWATSSLHNELRWIDGDILSPCPGELMNDRTVPRQSLIEEIARRAVYQTGIPGAGDSVSAEMTRHAIALLRGGKYPEAVAVFEFGVVQRPNDPEIRNNLGFCMIPIDPNAALGHLKAAVNMGYRPSVTNAYNQMCCYWALGRSRAALNIASAEWSKVGSTPQSSLLWRLTARREWELYDEDDPTRSIAFFAAEIARQEGWQEQEELWLVNMAARDDPAGN